MNDEEAAKITGLLRARRIGPGDRVGLALGERPEFSAALHGILRAGAVVVLIDPGASDARVEAEMARTHAELLIDEPSARLAGHSPDHRVTPRRDGDVAVIVGDRFLTHKDLARVGKPRLTRADLLTLLAETDIVPET